MINKLLAILLLSSALRCVITAYSSSASLAPSLYAPNPELIKTLLEKCRNDNIDMCNMCSLCQNGAFCQQKVKTNSLIKSNYLKSPQLSLQTNGKFLQVHNSNVVKLNANAGSVEEALDYLRGLIDFTCYCVPGYTGTYCQLDINECLSMPCSNNSTCIDKINSFECHCPPGFAGIFLFFMLFLIN
jgi:hypothetical protein